MGVKKEDAMFTGLDMYAAEVKLKQLHRRSELDHLVEEAMRANRTQPGFDIRLLGVLSRILLSAGQSLLQTGARLEQRYYAVQSPATYEESF